MVQILSAQNMDDDAPASPSTTTTGALDTASVSSNESRESWPDVPLEPRDADFSGDVFVRRDNKRLGWRRCVGSLARDFGPGGAPRDGVAATLRLGRDADVPAVVDDLLRAQPLYAASPANQAAVARALPGVDLAALYDEAVAGVLSLIHI